jgi:hypothetical protein
MPARIKATTPKVLQISEFRGAELLLLPCAYPLGLPSRPFRGKAIAWRCGRSLPTFRFLPL